MREGQEDEVEEGERGKKRLGQEEEEEYEEGEKRVEQE